MVLPLMVLYLHGTLMVLTWYGGAPTLVACAYLHARPLAKGAVRLRRRCYPVASHISTVEVIKTVVVERGDGIVA